MSFTNANTMPGISAPSPRVRNEDLTETQRRNRDGAHQTKVMMDNRLYGKDTYGTADTQNVDGQNAAVDMVKATLRDLKHEIPLRRREEVPSNNSRPAYRNVSSRFGAIGYAPYTDLMRVPKMNDVTFLRKMDDFSMDFYRMPLKALKGTASVLTMLNEIAVIELRDTKGEFVQSLKWVDMQVKSYKDEAGKFHFSLEVPNPEPDQVLLIMFGNIHPEFILVHHITGSHVHFTY